jgi:hypothetical protein
MDVGSLQAGEQMGVSGLAARGFKIPRLEIGCVFHCEVSVWAGILLELAKQQFFHAATQLLLKKLEQLSQRSGVSRRQAFEDWLTAMAGPSDVRSELTTKVGRS